MLITTHYLDEADALCDRLAIVEHGRIVAEGTADMLEAEVRGDVITLHLPDPSAADAVIRSSGLATHIERFGDDALRLTVGRGDSTVGSLLRLLDEAGIETTSLSTARPTLDDVFLRHTGRSRRDTAPDFSDRREGPTPCCTTFAPSSPDRSPRCSAIRLGRGHPCTTAVLSTVLRAAPQANDRVGPARWWKRLRHLRTGPLDAARALRHGIRRLRAGVRAPGGCHRAQARHSCSAECTAHRASARQPRRPRLPGDGHHARFVADGTEPPSLGDPRCPGAPRCRDHLCVALVHRQHDPGEKNWRCSRSVLSRSFPSTRAVEP